MSNANNLRRSKRLSSRAGEAPHEPEWIEDGSHSLHRSAQKSRRIQRAPLGDITRGSINQPLSRPNTRSMHQSPLRTGIDTSNMAFFSISSVRDIDSDAERHDLDATKIDDDDDEDQCDEQSLDQSFDDDEMIFSANKQRQEHERHLAVKSSNQTILPAKSADPVHHSQRMNLSPSEESQSSRSTSQQSSRSLHIDSSHSSCDNQPMDTLFSPMNNIHQPIPQPPSWSSHDCLKENGDVLFHYLRRSENDERFLCNPNYMTCFQEDLSFAMRAILIDWLVEVCEEYSLSTQTLFLGVGYLDRFLSLHKVSRSHLQLIGVTAVFIAAKYWEIKPPLVDDFVYISDHSYSRAQVLDMERCLLNALHFNLAAPTCWDFHRRYLSQMGMFSPDIEHFGDMCMELILCEPAVLTFKPSEIASAALLYAHWVVDGSFWTADLVTITRYNAEDLNSAVTLMEAAHMKQWHHMHQPINGRAPGPLKAVMVKYSKPVYNRVATTQAYKTPPS